MKTYIGMYLKFQTTSKEEASQLMTADNLIGDKYSIKVEYENGLYTAWMINKFNKMVGFFNHDDSKNINLLKSEGMEIHCILSFVAFTDNPGEGFYWGEAALLAYNPIYKDDFLPFVNSIALRIENGIKPDVYLTKEEVNQVIKLKGKWTPSKTIELPKKEKGTVIIKMRRSSLDKLIEQGRLKKPGCYIVSWLFILLLVFLILFSLKSCGIF